MPRLIHMCDTSLCYVCYDSIIMCDHSNRRRLIHMCQDSLIYAPLLCACVCMCVCVCVCVCARVCVCVWLIHMCQDSFIYAPLRHHTRRRRCLICLKSYRKRAINYRALLRKITHKDKACYASTPHYSWARRHCKVLQCVAANCSWLQRAAVCYSVLQSHSHMRHCNTL